MVIEPSSGRLEPTLLRFVHQPRLNPDPPFIVSSTMLIHFGIFSDKVPELPLSERVIKQELHR